jgi:hypothetical protein
MMWNNSAVSSPEPVNRMVSESLPQVMTSSPPRPQTVTEASLLPPV